MRTTINCIFPTHIHFKDKTVVIPDSEELHRVLGNKPLSEVFDDYIALYSKCQVCVIILLIRPKNAGL